MFPWPLARGGRESEFRLSVEKELDSAFGLESQVHGRSSASCCSDS